VRVVETGVAVLFAIAGLRSLWTWSRRGFEGTDPVDHALYALFVTGRVGLWFAFAGFFAIYGSIRSRGAAALDELEPYRWYVLVPLVLGAMQLLAGWFLGRRSGDEPGR
jgi:hypothetical protein